MTRKQIHDFYLILNRKQQESIVRRRITVAETNRVEKENRIRRRQAFDKQWWITHPEEIREVWRRFHTAHPEKRREIRKRRGHTPGLLWLSRKRPDLPMVCAIGGGLAQQVDHIIPISLGGPKKDPMNLRYLCAKHNRCRGPKPGSKKVLSDIELQDITCGN